MGFWCVCVLFFFFFFFFFFFLGGGLTFFKFKSWFLSDIIFHYLVTKKIVTQNPDSTSYMGFFWTLHRLVLRFSIIPTTDMGTFFFSFLWTALNWRQVNVTVRGLPEGTVQVTGVFAIIKLVIFTTTDALHLALLIHILFQWM